MKKLLLALLLACSGGALYGQSQADPLQNVAVRLDGGDAIPVGSVTSVGLSVPTSFSLSGSPITSSGTFTLGWATLTDDTILVFNGSGTDNKAVPNCTDTGGNHLNYTAASNTFSCGTSGTGGSTPTGTGFAFVTSGAYDAASKTAPSAANFIGLDNSYIYCREEFFAGGKMCLASQTSGTGSGVNTLNDPPSPQIGVASITTGTTTTGRAAVIGSNSTDAGAGYCTAGAGEVDFTARFEDLSTVGEEYAFWGGLLREITTQPTYGLYFKYDRLTDTHWITCSAQAGTRTCTNSSSTVNADQTYKLRIVWNSGCTSADFYIDGSNVRTETTNMPTAGVTPGIAVLKSAGTTARLTYSDYFIMFQTLTSAR